MSEMYDLRSDRLDLGWDSWADVVLSFLGEGVDTTGWVNVFEIFATDDDGETASGAALLTLTDGDGVTNTPSEDSEIAIAIPAEFYEDRGGQILYCRFTAVIDGLRTSLLHGRIDIA